MAEAAQHIGGIFGRLTVVARAQNNKNGGTRWICRCQCGLLKIVGGRSMVSGKTVSCGCFFSERMSKIHGTHHLSQSPEYAVWARIKSR